MYPECFSKSWFDEDEPRRPRGFPSEIPDKDIRGGRRRRRSGVSFPTAARGNRILIAGCSARHRRRFVDERRAPIRSSVKWFFASAEKSCRVAEFAVGIRFDRDTYRRDRGSRDLDGDGGMKGARDIASIRLSTGAENGCAIPSLSRYLSADLR